MSICLSLSSLSLACKRLTSLTFDLAPTVGIHKDLCGILLCSRGGEKEGHFVVKALEHKPQQAREEGAAFKAEFEWTQDGKMIRTTELYFKPPCLSR